MADPLVGQTLGGRFRILELIDRGGMGKIYRAEQQPLGRIVALKTLDIIDNTGEFKQRFFLEAASCAKLSHPNTVRVYDYGEAARGGSGEAGVYFLVMEFLAGRTLHQAIKEDAPLDPLRAIAIARQICGALEEAHRAGIVHRDLKPQNVFLTEHGEERDFVKIVDFGLVKDMQGDAEVSKAGNVLGSPMYMAPEQVEGKTIDPRTDVYALGLMLYTMLAGQTPYKRGDSLTVMMQQVHKDPAPFAEVDPRLKVHRTLEQVVRTAIKKDPAERFASMRDLSSALKVAAAQIRGEFPLQPIEISDGHVRAPAGLEPTEEVSKSAARSGGRRSAAPPPPEETSQHSLVSSMARPAAIGVVSLGAFAAVGTIALTALTLALAVVVLWPRGDAGPKSVPATPAAAVAVPAVAPASPVVATTPEKAPEAPPAPVAVRVHVDSSPAAAEVTENDVVIGNTPLVLDVTPGTPRTLTISATGHTSKTVRLDGASAALTVDLPKVPKSTGSSTRTNTSTSTPTSTSTSTSTPTNTSTPPTGFEPKRVDDVKNPFANH